MKKILSFSLFLLIFGNIVAQITPSKEPEKKEYTSLESALKEPEKVFRLNLSNQKINFKEDIWTRFPNLEFLSLKDDHLTNLPEGISQLKNLKILDLSGNDFTTLPNSFKNLNNLEELFLNNEKNMNLEKTIDETLSLLPKLRILHLENDHLKKLPKNINKVKNLETLYLNDNEFKNFPKEIKNLRDLKYIDFRNNQFVPRNPQQILDNYGVIIEF